MDPFTTYDRIGELISRVGIDVEMHTHNDFGMATANALAGVHAGAKWVGVTVIGLGERAGNAAMERGGYGTETPERIDLNFKTAMFRELAEYVSSAAKRTAGLETDRELNMFAHESGIHADGALRPRTYEVSALKRLAWSVRSLSASIRAPANKSEI